MPAVHVHIAQLTVLVTLAAPAVAGVVVSPTPTPRRAFVVTGANNLYAVDFVLGTKVGPLNPDGGSRVALRDLVVRDLDLANRPDFIDLLVFDDLGNGEAEILRYVRNAQTGEWGGLPVIRDAFTGPDGLSLGGGGALFFVDNPSTPRVWVLPPDRADLPPIGDGFATTPIPIDESPPCDRMVDTEVVKFQGPGLSFGDLLVLCQSPPLLLRYPKGRPCANTLACTSSERQVLFGLPSTETPTSLVFTPAGDLLMSSFDQANAGKILRFSIDAGSLDVQALVKDLPPGDARMVGGIQERGDGNLGAFLLYASPFGRSVSRYAPEPGAGLVLDPGSGVPNPVPFDPEGPVGIGIGTSRAAPTRPGAGSRTRPRESVLATFDRVLFEGLTESRLFVFDDPRLPLPQDDEPLYLCVPGSAGCPYADGPFFVDLGLPNAIPGRVRPLTMKSNGESHPFVLFDLTSTAGFEETVKLQALEDLVLGPDIYGCAEAVELGAVDELPLFFHGADLDDPPVVEGFGFFAVPSGCGSNFGRTFAFSSFLVGRLVLPGPLAAALPAVQGLRTALDEQTPVAQGGLRSYIAPVLGGLLFRLASEAEEGILGQVPVVAIGRLETLLQAVRDNRDGIDDSQRNVPGELQVRATAAIFLLCGGTNCSEAVDTHAEDVGEIFIDGFESGATSAWTTSVP